MDALRGWSVYSFAMRRTSFSLCLLGVVCLPLVLVAVGCDEASPVAPAGTTLSITVTPSQIGANGTATVRVTALKANGTAVNPGTEVRLDTTLGTIEPIVEIGDGGVATATLRGDGRVGTATVTARAGNAEPATVDVSVGKFAASITLQASPGQVGGGGSVQLLAVVRDDEARPLPGASVNFLTEVGTLESRGGLVTTNAQGQARDTLRVSEADVQAFTGVSFTAEAVVGGEGGTLQRDSVSIRILTGEPVPRFIARRGANQLQVVFDNESEGAPPLTFQWEFGDGATSTQDSPIHDYNQQGTFQVRLTVRNGLNQQESAVCGITVPVPENAPITCQQQQ